MTSTFNVSSLDFLIHPLVETYNSSFSFCVPYVVSVETFILKMNKSSYVTLKWENRLVLFYQPCSSVHFTLAWKIAFCTYLEKSKAFSSV